MAAKKMKYSLLIYSDRADNGASAALSLAQAIIASGHSLYRLFFYRDGVMIANNGSRIRPAHEATLHRDWQLFIQNNNLDAVACVSAAVRRQLVSEEEAQSTTSTYEHVSPTFHVAGLGQLADALANSDRVVSFG